MEPARAATSPSLATSKGTPPHRLWSVKNSLRMSLSKTSGGMPRKSRGDPDLVVHIDARGAAADRVDPGKVRRGLLERVVDPRDVVGRVLLEIRVPRDLLGEHDLAVDDRRSLPVAAADVEADPAALEVAAHREPRVAFLRELLGGDGLDAERPAVDLVPHERMVEFPVPAGSVDGRQVARDLRRPRDTDRASAPLPQQELEESLGVAEAERRLGMSGAQDAALVAGDPAVWPFKDNDHHARPGICGHDRTVGAVPEGCGQKVGI